MIPSSYLRGVFVSLALLGGVVGASAADARRQEVDLVLVLAIDASGSVDYREWDLNKNGYAQALLHPEVLHAVANGPIGAIAISAMKWGHPEYQEVVLPWTVIRNLRDAEKAAGTLMELPRNALGNTSISGGIRYAADMIARAEFDAPRKVIDVSGDGFDNTSFRRLPNNQIFGSGGGSYFTSRISINPNDTALLHAARDAAVQKGITINGLPILTDMPWLDEYYRDSVIGGPGAFWIAAKDFESFAVAVRRKIVLEIAGLQSDEYFVRFAHK